MKKIKILCHVLCFLLGICVYQLIKLNNVKPEVKAETKTEVKYILGVKKECEEKEGVLNIRDNYLNPAYVAYILGESPYDYSVTCTKYYKEGNKDITETIFDYKI